MPLPAAGKSRAPANTSLTTRPKRLVNAWPSVGHERHRGRLRRVVADAEEHDNFLRGPDEQYAKDQPSVLQRARTLATFRLRSNFRRTARPPQAPRSRPRNLTLTRRRPRHPRCRACAGDDATTPATNASGSPTRRRRRRRSTRASSGPSHWRAAATSSRSRPCTESRSRRSSSSRRSRKSTATMRCSWLRRRAWRRSLPRTPHTSARRAQGHDQRGNMKSRARRVLAVLRALVIDEISMVDAEFLDWYMNSVLDAAPLLRRLRAAPPVPDKHAA